MKSRRNNKFTGGAAAAAAVIQNSAILYFVFIVSIIDLVFLAWTKDIRTLSVFVLSGFVMSFLNKNMTVILFFAFVLANIYKYGFKQIREGAKNKGDSEEDESDGMKNLEKLLENYDDEEGMEEEEGMEDEEEDKKEGATTMEEIKKTNTENTSLNDTLNKLQDQVNKLQAATSK
jgi:hypothetical protein